jgi:VWFA-related protein
MCWRWYIPHLLPLLLPWVASPQGVLTPEQPKFTARANLVFLPTRVENRKGETVYGLKSDQFIVEDNGVRQIVQMDEDPESKGLSLVVVVQCSRSAPAEFSKLKGLPAMIDAITGDAPHEVAVMSYGEGPYVLSDFSGDSDVVRRGLSRLKSCGEFHAASIDAAYFAINLLKRRPTQYRRAILLISETRDHGSRSKMHEVAAELGITDTVIYTVAFSAARDEFVDAFRSGINPQPPPAAGATGQAAGRPPSTMNSSPPPDPMYEDHPPAFVWPPQFLLVINALRRNSAQELAVLSGGESLHFTTRRDFDESLQRISNQIHNYYVLRFQPADPASGLHSLRVRVAGYPDAMIQTRRSYWAGVFEARP